jgi:hypothetical protein
MNDDEPLRAWTCELDSVPYILETMRSKDSFMQVVSVDVTKGRALIVFQGSYVFLEDEMKAACKDIVSSAGWPGKINENQRA